MTHSAMTDDELIAAAREAALKAYAPYSRFSVGCAIQSADGEIVTGVNVENACYRLGVCAEQSALSAAQIGIRPGGRDGLHPLRRLPPDDL
jgi:cytidine deaminase